jgi:osmotically-inducible protein OsmY
VIRSIPLRRAPLAALALVSALPLLALLSGCDRLRPKEAAETGSTAALGLRVQLELLTELGVDGTRVEVEADEGRVRLGGEVRKRATAELAERVARGVEGVREVENRIRVAPEDGATKGAGTTSDQVAAFAEEAERELADAALETRVRLALVDRLGSDGFRIGVDAASGTVTLEFPAEIERARRGDAKKTAEKVEGVGKVVTLEAR